jgi:cyclophilin family peptidyl-prolyl cis-trans isomerase
VKLWIAAALLLLAACSPKGDLYVVRTSQGEIEVEVFRDWAPNGAARFLELVNARYYDGARFFRVLPNFVAQVGLAGDPAVTAQWVDKTIPDDPKKESNRRGTLCFAKSGRPNSASTQIFINKVDNQRLDEMGFVPFGRVVRGLEVVDRLYHRYGESPNQGRIIAEGNTYLQKDFPQLDYIVSISPD